MTLCERCVFCPQIWQDQFGTWWSVCMCSQCSPEGPVPDDCEQFGEDAPDALLP